MFSILRVRDEEGNVIDIPAIRGSIGPRGLAGASGKDGVSATHSWNGTVLSITSASGTSSADLKGEKGDKGDKGETGPAYTLNDTDKNTIAAAVKATMTAADVGAGTFAGQVVANASAVATVETAQVRNIYAGTSDMTAGSSPLATGTLYFVYE